jgi:hypothetical protein
MYICLYIFIQEKTQQEKERDVSDQKDPIEQETEVVEDSIISNQLYHLTSNPISVPVTHSGWSLETPSNHHRRLKEYSTLETIYEEEGDDCDYGDEKVHGAEEEDLAHDKSTLVPTIMGMFIMYSY